MRFEGFSFGRLREEEGDQQRDVQYSAGSVEVLFLNHRELCGFITGQTIWVDGGLFSKPPWPREYE
jgi:hypothetical protein